MLDKILSGNSVRVLVQGATGRTARRHISMMQGHGTNIVAGVSLRSDVTDIDGIPVFSSCGDAVAESGAEVSVIMVPPDAVLAAVEDAVTAGIKLMVAVTEGVPTHDAIRAVALTRDQGATLIGPTTPGLVMPGKLKLGFLPEACIRPGPLAVIARSGTLSYELSYRLAERGIGQSFWVGAGGDPVKGTRFADFVPPLKQHGDTSALLVIGEIGGTDEEDFAAALLSHNFGKPVFALLAGSSAPEGVTMGHAGALVHGKSGTLASKTAALENAGVSVYTRIRDVVEAVQSALPRQND
ncbi:MAG: succinate--CoA ligase subunit alpha [Rhodospirillales bacterium]|nr:succinate--CoA ligase subunit alpha [Rhodospirillales bacterium]